MGNQFEYATVFQKSLDQQVLQKSTTSWMEANAGQVKYEGGKYIKIPVVSTDGLGDYDRQNGYVNGSVSLKYQVFEMEQDRGRSFTLDAMDVDETNFAASAGNVLSSFQLEQVIPEIDAYRYSKLSALAKDKGIYEEVNLKDEDLLNQLRKDIARIKDVTGITDLVVTMSVITQSNLSKAKDYDRVVNTGEFNDGKINSVVKVVDEVPIKTAPSDRLKTEYQFLDGVTGGQEHGGFKPAPGAKNINWLIMPRKAPLAVSKTDKVKIVTPEVNQDADAWKLGYRKYHDLWVADNKAKLLLACVDAGV